MYKIPRHERAFLFLVASTQPGQHFLLAELDQ
jgi:hypothetical protein